MSGDHWVNGSPTTMHVSSVGRTKLMRCKGCWQMFRRPLESTSTCPNCPPGTLCTPNLAASR